MAFGRVVFLKRRSACDKKVTLWRKTVGLWRANATVYIFLALARVPQTCNKMQRVLIRKRIFLYVKYVNQLSVNASVNR